MAKKKQLKKLVGSSYDLTYLLFHPNKKSFKTLAPDGVARCCRRRVHYPSCWTDPDHPVGKSGDKRRGCGPGEIFRIFFMKTEMCDNTPFSTMTQRRMADNKMTYNRIIY